MASSDLQAFLRRVQTDSGFLNLFLVDPQQALTEYSLSSAEEEVLLRRDTSIYSLLPAAASDDDDDDDLEQVLEAFPEISLPQLNPPTIPQGGGGLQLSLPPLTLTLGQPPRPASCASSARHPCAAPPPLPPDPFPPVPPPPDPPPPPLPDPPDIPPPPPMHPDPPTSVTFSFSFRIADASRAQPPDALIAEIRESRGEARARAIERLLGIIDGRTT